MNLEKKNLVSVVIPVYNAEDTILACLESILTQSYEAIEVICVDDGSRDKSNQILKKIQTTDSRVKILSFKRNKGVAAARNAGLKEASGKYISFCDADDLWMSQKLSIQISEMRSRKLLVAHSSVIYRWADEDKTQQMPLIVTFENMKVRNFIPNSSGIYDADRLGKFYQKEIFHEDYIMWSEIIKQAGCSVGFDKPLAVIRRTPSSLSGNKFNSLMKHFEAQKVIFNFGYLKIFLYFAVNIFQRWKSRER